MRLDLRAAARLHTLGFCDTACTSDEADSIEVSLDGQIEPLSSSRRDSWGCRRRERRFVGGHAAGKYLVDYSALRAMATLPRRQLGPITTEPGSLSQRRVQMFGASPLADSKSRRESILESPSPNLGLGLSQAGT